MKWILTLLLLFITTACASDTINKSETKASQMGDNGLELDVGGQRIKLEFFNMHYKHINKACMIQKIQQFDNMTIKYNFDMQKHKPSWLMPFSPPKKPYDKKMILLTYSDQKYALTYIDPMLPQNKLLFFLLPVSPYQMTYKHSFTRGWSNEDIDFESCFQ